MTIDFFHAPKDESRVKADIVEAFFVGWARIIGGYQKSQGRPVNLGYLDLFAGPGCYDDGTETTAIRVLNRVLENEDRRRGTRLVFNEWDGSLLERLESNVERVQREQNRRLSIDPIFTNEKVDPDYSSCLALIVGRPTLIFVDPWGYVGLTLRLLRDLVSLEFGNDLIFFFNYRRINAAVSNDLFRKHMDALFGSRSKALREQVSKLHGYPRELAIMEAISSELSENVGEFVQRFRFGPTTDEASHYLFFVSKSRKGHELMTNIMAKRGTVDRFGVPTFEFTMSQQDSLFAIDPVETLADGLVQKYRGQTMAVVEIFQTDSPGKQLQIKQYKSALMRLEARGFVEATPAANERRPGTMADHVTIRFPGGEE